MQGLFKGGPYMRKYGIRGNHFNHKRVLFELYRHDFLQQLIQSVAGLWWLYWDWPGICWMPGTDLWILQTIWLQILHWWNCSIDCSYFWNYWYNYVVTCFVEIPDSRLIFQLFDCIMHFWLQFSNNGNSLHSITVFIMLVN